MIVGFAGLGRMGFLMAENLAQAGFELVVWNRSKDKADALCATLVEAGLSAAAVATPGDLANASDVVVTMLADDPASLAVHCGGQGLFSGQRARIFVEMGTMSPQHIDALDRAKPSGALVLDAPVSGATGAAQSGQLLIMAGAAEPDIAALKPLFAALGKQTMALGALGRGAIMKLAVNALIHGINQTLAESLALAQASGIEKSQAFDVIEASAAAAPMLGYRRPLYLEEEQHAVTFTVALARKDMEITADLAQALGTAMPQGQVTLDQLRQAEAAGYAQRDMASMVEFNQKQTRSKEPTS